MAKVKDLVCFVNQKMELWCLSDAKDHITSTFGVVEAVDNPMADRECFNGYTTSELVFKCEDGYVKVFGVDSMEPHIIDPEDCMTRCKAVEVVPKEVTLTIFIKKDK